MGRKVVVTSVFETDIENIWCKIQDIETLREICKPKASFISYGNIPPVWKESLCRLFRPEPSYIFRPKHRPLFQR